MQFARLSHVFTIKTATKHYEETALTESAIRRLVRSGEIPSRKVGAKYLITATAIENWLNSVSGQTEPAPGDIRRVME